MAQDRFDVSWTFYFSGFSYPWAGCVVLSLSLSVPRKKSLVTNNKASSTLNLHIVAIVIVIMGLLWDF